MLSDPIAAIATPYGRSAIAMVRVSGDGALDVAAKVLAAFAPRPFRTARLTSVRRPSTGEELDRALYVTFQKPASFTGEDVVEISTHGGVLVPGEVLQALLESGARHAERGEFTRRALLNGRMDLLQAEAIGDLVDATAPRQRRAALEQLDGALSRRIDGLRHAVIGLEALVSYEIDFPEEDAGPVPEEQIGRTIEAVRQQLAGLAATSAEGERLREGALVVIAGLPNAGKSSLFNAMLGSERAIVTDVPGTTRDAIEAPATCDGFPVRLVDTAGMRTTTDVVEQKGVEVSHRYLRAADLILYCAESGHALTADERRFLEEQRAPAIVVSTKCDGGAAPDEGWLAVSAHTGRGIPELRVELARAAFAALSVTETDPLLTRERHVIAVRQALQEVEAFRDARQAGVETVFAATHLRAAVAALEDVIGLVSPEDVLDRLFATFCVGK